MFHGVRLGWGGIRRVVALVMLAHGLYGCSGSPLALPEITSTPVATPIIVGSSSASSTSTPTPTPAKRPANESKHQAIKALIETAHKSFPGRSAILFFDLDSDDKVALEADRRFESASLVKLVILFELHRQFQVGKHTPEETLVLLESQKRGGSGQLKETPEGSRHSLASLAELMICQSDNTATQMLTDLLGLEAIEHGGETIGLANTTVDRDIFDFEAIDQGRDNLTTAKDIATFLRQLAHQELPGSQAMHEILEKQKRNDMIGRGFPEHVRVAHKTGELDGILHDAAIVYAPRGAFILVCLSDQVSDKEAAKDVWAQMALDILEIYSEPHPSPTPDSDSI